MILLMGVGALAHAEAPDIDTAFSTQAGWLSGDDTLPVQAGTLDVAASVEPCFEASKWRFRVPVDASHRETFGASLAETAGDVGGELRYRHSSKLRASAEAAVGGRWRPDWPDQYQVQDDGSLGPTTRYSRWERSGGIDLATIPFPHQHVGLEARTHLYVYAKDPNFDPIGSPMHLTPDDRFLHEVDFDWMHHGDRFKVGGGVETGFERYLFLFARDAGSGYTHAGPGGDPPNPLQEIFEAEPFARFDWGKRKDPVSFDIEYGYEIQVDHFEGYYSYRGHHPSFDVDVALGDKTQVSAGSDLYLRRYGEGSFAEVGSHPALEYGDRRVETKVTGSIAAERRLTSRLSLELDSRLAVRRTNFPGYEPGVYPASRQYDIDWNYLNWWIATGFTWTL